jgi:DNA polymerase-3 subunit delta
MADARVWRARQGIVSKCLQRHSANSIRRLLDKACEVDRIVKGARSGQPWNALTELTLALARPRSAPKPVAVSGS